MFREVMHKDIVVIALLVLTERKASAS